MASKNELPMPEPGTVCPCCKRKVPKNAKPPMTEEEKKVKRQEYNKKRNTELKELRELKERLDTEKLGE